MVEEVLKESPGRTGSYCVYQATKRWLTTPELQQRLAQQLGVPPSSLAFPALKDKAAVATQHFSLRGAGAGRLAGPGFSVRMVGRLARPLTAGDLRGNRFTVTLRGLPPGEAADLGERLAAVAAEGLPNYFDRQRFGSYMPGGVFMGKAILQGDAQAALRAYLAQPAPGESPALGAFKVLAGAHWGDWDMLFQHAPRSNHRSLLTFLRDHPADFRKALNLITPRLLPLLLSAYQSFLWNRMVSRFLQARLAGGPAQVSFVEVAGEPLAMYRGISSELAEELRSLAMPLPHHRASFASAEMQAIALQVLAEEGLALEDLKARLLKRAYLPRGHRPMAVFPQETSWEALAPSADDGTRLRLKFFLPPGSYGTLVLRALGTESGDPEAGEQSPQAELPGEDPAE